MIKIEYSNDEKPNADIAFGVVVVISEEGMPDILKTPLGADIVAGDAERVTEGKVFTEVEAEFLTKAIASYAFAQRQAYDDVPLGYGDGAINRVRQLSGLPPRAPESCGLIMPTDYKQFISASAIIGTDIERFEPLLDKTYFRKFTAMVGGVAGTGKSTIAVTDAVYMALDPVKRAVNGWLSVEGKVTAPDTKPTRVWYHSAEDPVFVVEAKIEAICKINGWPLPEKDALIITSGRDKNPAGELHMNVNVTIMDGNTAIILDGWKCFIIGFIKANKIDIGFFDPLVDTHQTDENSNMQMAVTMGVFRDISEEAECCCALIHHARKGTDGDSLGDGGEFRGASSIGGNIRSGRAVVTMSKEVGKKLGVQEGFHRNYVQIFDAKNNYAPPITETVWLKRHSVEIANGDHIGVLKRTDEFDNTVDLSEEAKHKAAVADYFYLIRQRVELDTTYTIPEVAKILADDESVEFKDQKHRKTLGKYLEESPIYYGKEYVMDRVDQGTRHWRDVPHTRHQLRLREKTDEDVRAEYEIRLALDPFSEFQTTLGTVGTEGVVPNT